METESWREIVEYVDNDVMRHFLKNGDYGEYWIPGDEDTGGLQEVSGRIRPQGAWTEGRQDLTGAVRDAALAREAMDQMGSDYVSLFPTMFLGLGASPFPHVEPHLMRAWSRWITERLMPEEPRIVTTIPLPFTDVEASMAMVEEFADHPGVTGFMVTSVRYDATWRKEYMKLYRAIEERGMPLCFHSGFSFRDRVMNQFNKFISVHSLGFPLHHMIQATNWVVNGLPELFPNLKVVFIEGGLAWVPFLMQRLDHEFLMRPSEAPLLQRRPSEYLKEMYYTTQPLEAAHPKLLQETFEMIGAETQLLYASDWPHWDWDPPRRIWDIPFLSEQAKKNILGENAARLFTLPQVASRS
jgi:predicted TIM-barrel fold metal-dependent hydrolase